jgi:ribosome biogenesis GTPase A
MTGVGARSRRKKVLGQAAEIQRSIQAASILVEVRDARVPFLSEMAGFLGKQKNKFRAVVLTKSDLASPEITSLWIDKLTKEGTRAIAVNLTDIQKSKKQLTSFFKELAACKSSALDLARFGIVGLPNVGKSTLINRIIGQSKVKTGDRPGITRGKQWIRAAEDLIILDTPGVIQLFSGIENRLGPEFFKLCLCNVVPAGQFSSISIATEFLAFIITNFAHWPCKTYCADMFEKLFETRDVERFFEDFCHEQGLLRIGGVADLEKASERFISDFRKGKMGRFSLESPAGTGEGLWHI